MKKLMGSSDENPFTGILKSFMQSQLGAGLGSGLGDAIRARSAPQPVAAQPAALPAPATPNLPTGYLSTFEPRLIAATDDGERVACVVDSLLALATDDHWGALSNVFLQATLQDDLVKVNQSLYKLFNAWAQSGSTIGKDKADAAIRAVNTSWDLIVTSLCKMMDHPIPETLRQRQFAAAAAAEKSTSNGQSGPSSPATSTPTSDAVSACSSPVLPPAAGGSSPARTNGRRRAARAQTLWTSRAPSFARSAPLEAHAARGWLRVSGLTRLREPRRLAMCPSCAF